MAAKQPPGPQPQDAAPDQPAEHDTPPGPRRTVGEYLDETPRTYLWPDGPQSVERGDVVALPDGWKQDGRFGPTSKKPTRLRDNHPDQRAATAERQTRQRAAVHARLAEEQSGKGGEQQ